MTTFSSSLVSGMLVGFLVTAPVGPICVLCIQRSLACGRDTGIASGFGSAVALTLYGTLGAVGVTAIAQMPLSVRFVLTLAGAIILAFIGWRLLRSAPVSPDTSQANSLTLSRAALSTFALEIVNPASIMIFFGLFASMQEAPAHNAMGFAEVGLGILLASMLWWVFLSSAVALFRSFFSPSRLVWLNRIAGVIIILLGLRPLIQMM